jgi:HAD superfamily hydrolase (TIGR01509 family)
MLQATLFDFNGVLVDDERLHLDGFNAALRPLDVTISPEDYNDRYLGFDDRGAFVAMLRDRGLAHDDARVAALIAAKSVVYAELAARSLTVFEGAAALLKSAAGHGPVAIVSGALRGEIDVALRLMAAEGAPRVIVAAEDVAACKPDPEGYLLGLDRLSATAGELDPGRCVAIEDSVAGVQSARAAGLCVVAVAHTYDAGALRAAGAHAVFPHVRELTVDALAEAVRAADLHRR